MLRRDKRFGFFVSLPVLTILVTFFIYPLLFSVYVSLTDYTVPGVLSGRPIDFVGLKNYADILSDPKFMNALWVTILFTVTAIIVEFSLALLLAVNTSRIKRGRSFFITTFLLSIMIAPVVVALLFKFVLSDELGVLNILLRSWGLVKENIPWLTNPWLAKLSVIMIDAWQATSWIFLLTYAAIISIPAELYESAQIDGASGWRTFTNITLPMIKSTVIYSMVIRFMDAFRIFDSVYMVTNGGPGGATDTLALYIYRRSWKEMDLSTSSAASLIMMVLLVVGIFIINRIGKGKKEDIG